MLLTNVHCHRYLYPYHDIENTGTYNWKHTWNHTVSNHPIHQHRHANFWYVCLLERVYFNSKNAAIMCGMYIINGVNGPEPRSSGGNTSPNPQVSALIPRPAFNGMERYCGLTAPSHHLNQCWFINKCVLWCSLQNSFTKTLHELYPLHVFGDYAFKIITTSTRANELNKHTQTLVGKSFVLYIPAGLPFQHVYMVAFCYLCIAISLYPRL